MMTGEMTEMTTTEMMEEMTEEMMGGMTEEMTGGMTEEMEGMMEMETEETMAEMGVPGVTEGLAMAPRLPRPPDCCLSGPTGFRLRRV